MIIYLLKFSACLAILMVFYKLLLETSSVHKFKRFYLLGAFVLALVIPSLTFIEYIEPVVVKEFASFVVTDFDMTETTQEVIEVDYTPIILWSLYGLGVFIFLLKFCFNLYNIVSRIRHNPKLKSGSFINVLVSNLKIPHTFFNYIFFNKHKFELNKIPKEVLIHEQAHAKQKHSIDVLLLELLQIIFWFNPLIYLLKREVKLNHEYLADQAVLQNGIQPSTYQTILLAFSSKAEHQELANAINYSSIKKRFTVMKTHTSKQSIWLRSLLLLPVLAILLYSFTEKEQIVKENSVTVENYISEGITDAQMKEYNDFIITFNTTDTIEFSKYERIVSIYNLMSETQKASVERYPKVPGVDLSETKAKVPTAEDFESWKNEKEFAIWIDGVHVPNVKLNSYNLNDIAHYVGSFVYKNARSEKFPQPYQFSLYTKKGFKTTYQDSKVNLYRELTRTYSEALQLYLKGNQTDNSELKLLKERCDRIYKSISKDELSKHNLRPAPPVPMQKSFQEGATPEQVAEYNQLAKKHNEKPLNRRIIKMKDYEYLDSLYKLMSDSQKKTAQPFPIFPPPPAPPVVTKKVSDLNTLWVLLNSKGQFLLNDKLATLKSIEAKFKSIANDKNASKEIVFKHDKAAPKDIVNKVNALIDTYKLENIYDMLPPPPPPPAPPKSIKGNGPNGSTYYPIPPPIPDDATPEQRAAMQATIDKFEKEYKRKVLQAKSESGKIYSMIANDDIYEPTQDENKIITGFIKINGTPHYFVSIDNNKKYYNREGFEVNTSGKTISEKQVNASDIIPGQYVTKVHSDGQIVSEFKDNKPSRDRTLVDIPSPPPAPKSTLDFVIDLAKKNAKFFYKNEAVSSDKAIKLLKQNPDLNVLAKDTEKKQPLVYISVEPIHLKKTKI